MKYNLFLFKRNDVRWGSKIESVRWMVCSEENWISIDFFQNTRPVFFNNLTDRTKPALYFCTRLTYVRLVGFVNRCRGNQRLLSIRARCFFMTNHEGIGLILKSAIFFTSTLIPTPGAGIVHTYRSTWWPSILV